MNTLQGHRVSNPKDIADCFSDFYSKRYNLKDDAAEPSPDLAQMNDFLKSINLPTPTPEQNSQLNKPFSEQEIKEAICDLPLHKAPGPDGFCNEYYRTFLTLLSPQLCKTQFVATGHMPKESLEAVITIPKPSKTHADPANYRPISLINTDTKLYVKIQATCLSRHIASLVHPDQVGFVPQRQAPDCTRRFVNFIQWAEYQQTPSLLLSLDVEKAFHRVHWGYLSTVLQRFIIQGPFNTAVMNLYSCHSTRVQTLGLTSKPFDITNGTRQGCPLSPLIFND